MGRTSEDQTLNDQLTNLVTMLEKESADLVQADPQQLIGIIDRRREILSRIWASLSEQGIPEQREELARRIQAIYDRDSRLIVALQKQYAAIEKQLESLVQARSAIRGYRSGESEHTAKLDRIA
jgi:hypothetical protein